MKKINSALFLFVTFLCGFYFTGAYASDSVGDMVLPGYSQRHLLKIIDKKEDSDNLLWNGREDSKVNSDSDVVGDSNFYPLASPILKANENLYGCLAISKSKDAGTQNVFIYVDKLKKHEGDGYGVFMDYPDNYVCKPDAREIDALLSKRIESEKQVRSQIIEAERESSLVTGQCDGKQMYSYVDWALNAGMGVLNVASNEAYGGAAVSLALRSSTMGHYNSAISDIRDHDLYLARSGCKSLKDGPTKEMLSRLKQMDVKIGKLVSSQYNQKGVITDGFGGLK